jgi:four helix bundle protein
MNLKSFEELECWKAARDVRQYIRTITRRLPDSERFDLTDNMIRASRSVTRNIAEGFGRYSYKDNVRFCIIARGSLVELIDDIITCTEEKYITDVENKEARKLIERANALLNGYINYLERANANPQSGAAEDGIEYLPEDEMRVTDNG